MGRRESRRKRGGRLWGKGEWESGRKKGGRLWGRKRKWRLGGIQGRKKGEEGWNEKRWRWK